MTFIDHEGNEFDTLEEMIGSWPKPTFWERVWRKIRNIKDIPWWFKYRLFSRHKYHIIKLNLEPGYYDADMRILHAVMETTEKFVDFQNSPRGHVAWDSDPGHIMAFASFTAAANWWKEHKNTIFETADFNEEAKEREEIQRLLHGVIDNLWYMWD